MVQESMYFQSDVDTGRHTPPVTNTEKKPTNKGFREETSEGVWEHKPTQPRGHHFIEG